MYSANTVTICIYECIEKQIVVLLKTLFCHASDVLCLPVVDCECSLYSQEDIKSLCCDILYLRICRFRSAGLKGLCAFDLHVIWLEQCVFLFEIWIRVSANTCWEVLLLKMFLQSTLIQTVRLSGFLNLIVSTQLRKCVVICFWLFLSRFFS